MTDVTPITPSHVCASCKATISTMNVYEGHTDTCMQPEVRMRRLEWRVNYLVGAMQELQEAHQALVEHVRKETHGISEEPSTQRTGEPKLSWCPSCGRVTTFEGQCALCETRDRIVAPADPSPAEPAGPEGDSAVPAGSQPERSG